MREAQEDDEKGDITDGVKKNMLEVGEGIGQSNCLVIS